MTRFIAASVLLLVSFRALAGQDTTYLATTEYPNGRQVVAIYLGANWCKPCGDPALKSAIRHMKPLMAAHAKDSNAVLNAIIVAFDRSLADALIFIEANGTFDEYVIGNDITSLAAERFLWGDSLAEKGVPQVIVFERLVLMERGARGIDFIFGEPRILQRKLGDEIVPWVRGGAAIWTSAPAP